MKASEALGYGVVTGGAGLLGSVVTRRLLEEGRDVVLLDRQVTRRPGVSAIEVDVTDEVGLTQALAEVLADRGAPSALAMCHGWSPKRPDGTSIPEVDVSAAQFNEVLDANLTSCFVLLRTLVPAMADRGFGRVATIGSAAALTGRTTAGAAYSAAKAGITALVRTFAVKYAEHGVLVNEVTPGKIRNPNWPDDAKAIAAYLRAVPLGRLADVDEVADYVSFLLSPRNTYITGQQLIIDGGRLS